MRCPGHATRDYTTVIQAAAKDCASVVELGAQFGNNLAKLPFVPRRVGVEVHLPYLDDRRCVKGGIVWINQDARDFCRIMPDASYDLVLLMDFVEHFDHDEAVKIVEEAKRIAARRVLWWCPIGEHKQDYDEWNLGGEHWQTHRSTWSVADMEALGFDAALWENHHGPTNARGEPHSRDAAFGLWERL